MAMAAKKVLLLRSAEGKVLMAPAWDERPFAQFLPPLETGAPTRALELLIHHWTAHNRAEGGDLWGWDAEFVRRIGDQEGLLQEVHAAAVLLKRQSLADLIAAGSGHGGSVVASVSAAASCARGHQLVEDEVLLREEEAEPKATTSTAWSAVGPAPATPLLCAPPAAAKRRIFSSPARSTASTISTARSKPPCSALLPPLQS